MTNQTPLMGTELTLKGATSNTRQHLLVCVDLQTVGLPLLFSLTRGVTHLHDWH
jgi:hypothetical protein